MFRIKYTFKRATLFAMVMPFVMQPIVGFFMVSNLGIYCAEAKHYQQNNR